MHPINWVHHPALAADSVVVVQLIRNPVHHEGIEFMVRVSTPPEVDSTFH